MIFTFQDKMLLFTLLKYFSNIFFDVAGDIKIGDFGLAIKHGADSIPDSSVPGTVTPPHVYI